jgi:hypothetical protein
LRLREYSIAKGYEDVAATQEYAKHAGLDLVEGPYYRKDTFLWLKGLPGTTNLANPMYPLQAHAVRGYYYTSLVGDPDKLRGVEATLKDLGFTPRVFSRLKGQSKAKGVDITLATDLLGHAFRDHFAAALLIAGDGDYVPLVEEVKRLGKLLYVGFLENHGLSAELKIVADDFFEMEWILSDVWRKPG